MRLLIISIIFLTISSASFGQNEELNKGEHIFSASLLNYYQAQISLSYRYMFANSRVGLLLAGQFQPNYKMPVRIYDRGVYVFKSDSARVNGAELGGEFNILSTQGDFRVKFYGVLSQSFKEVQLFVHYYEWEDGIYNSMEAQNLALRNDKRVYYKFDSNLKLGLRFTYKIMHFGFESQLSLVNNIDREQAVNDLEQLSYNSYPTTGILIGNPYRNTYGAFYPLYVFLGMIF